MDKYSTKVRIEKAFSLVELMVVVVLVGILLGIGYKGIYGSSQANDRLGNLEATRLVRHIHDRIEADIRSLTTIGAPTFNKVSLSFLFNDALNRKIRYENRADDGSVFSTPEDAEKADRVTLVRIEKDGDKKTETRVASSELIQFVVFRRLGKSLLGVDVQLDHEKLKLKKKSSARYHLIFSLSRCF